MSQQQNNVKQLAHKTAERIDETVDAITSPAAVPTMKEKIRKILEIFANSVTATTMKYQESK